MRFRLVLALALPLFLAAPVSADRGSETTGLAGEPSLVLPLPAPSPVRRTPLAGRTHGQALGHEVAATWVRIRVASKGVQEIRGSDLAALGLALDAYDPRALRLYVRPGLPLLPEDVIDPGVGLAEVSMRVDGAGDGRFDPADRLLFWGLAASGWHDEYGVPGAAPVDWLDHPYESQNTYWLALDPVVSGQPARWPTRDVAPVRPEAAPVDTFRARIHFEENLSYVEWAYETGLPWDRWAARLHSSSPLNREAELDGIVPGTPARLRARFWGVRSTSPVTTHSLAVDLNGAPVARPSWSGASRYDVDTTGTWLVEGRNHLALTLAPPGPPRFSDEVSVHFWELHFARRFVARADSLEFVAPPTPAVAAFTLAPFSTTDADSFHLLDVTDPLAPIALVGSSSFDTSGAEGVRLHDDRPGSRIFAAAAPAWRHPELERVTIHDPRHGGADYLVLCPDTLVLAAHRLADHRRAYPPFPGATAAVVRLSDVYAAYAGGRLDPTAIRNFLADAVAGGAWSPAPSYVCLLGDATTDHAGRSGFEPPGMGRRLVPTHEAFFAGEAFENDAWLADFDVAPEAGDVPEIAIGRLPVRGLDAAIQVVAKVIRGDTRQPEIWAAGGNRLLWSVDDASQRNAPDPLGGEFTASVETMDRETVPGWVERRKVNLLEHPPEPDGTKPSGRDSLIAELRRGTAVWAYVGRGGGFKMADEDLFRISDVAALEDVPRLPFLVSLTSATGGFASPFPLLAESLVVDRQGGVLAAFASSANTFVLANRELGKALFASMFAPPPPGATLESGPTLGAIALGAARGAFDRANNRSYNLLGDPGSRLPYPPRDVRMSLFDDVTGLALADSIPRGRRVRVEGVIHAGRGTAAPFDPSFSGGVHLSVSDAPPIHAYPLPGSPGAYEGNANLVQTARTLTSDGRFVSRFVVPVSARPGQGARVQALATGFGTASGATRITLGGIQPDPADTSGPVITFQFLPDGEIVAPNARYRIDFEDPSGILLGAAAAESRVTITLDDGPATDITDAVFLDRFLGMTRYIGSLPGLGDGDHVLVIAASDHLADPSSGASGVHRTELRVPFRVAGYLATPAVDARALPNPFTPEAGTTLVLRANVLAGSAEVAIHDVRGRRVRTLRSGSTVPPFQLAWNGRDDSGRRLAAGVYPWRAVVSSLTGDDVQAFEGRLVLVR